MLTGSDLFEMRTRAFFLLKGQLFYTITSRINSKRSMCRLLPNPLQKAWTDGARRKSAGARSIGVCNIRKDECGTNMTIQSDGLELLPVETGRKVGYMEQYHS